MAVRFTLGRAGSGKTRRCFDSIVEALREAPLGPAIIWILPKQATFQAQRELACASGLGGFCRARIVSFDLLGREVLAECNGAAIPEVTHLGRQMILGHLLRRHEPQLQFFRGVARQPGLAAEMDATFAELERSGNTAETLASLVHDLEDSDPADAESKSLLAKMRDVHLLYDAYSAYLGQERLDPHRRLQQVLDCLESCTSFRGATVYVDGFLEFTDNERRMLAGLAKVCAGVEITLLIDPASPTVANPHVLPGEMSLFHRTEETYRRLVLTFDAERIEINRPVSLQSYPRFTDSALAVVEGCGFEGRFCPEARHDGLELIEAPDRRSEVDVAARKIQDLIAAGHRFRDIAVLMRSVDDYHELINASFREHGIASFVDRRRAAIHHPLLQFIRAVLQIGGGRWPHEAMMNLLKSGLVGFTAAESDELENYALLHRVRGSAWGDDDWQYIRNERRDDEGELHPAERVELDRINRLRQRITARLKPFTTRINAQPTMPIRQIVAELFRLLETFNIRRTLADWMQRAVDASQLEQRAEHEQVWSNLVELFDQMVDLLGDEPVDLEQFSAILESGLEQFDLALTPPTVDQVLVGQVDRTRTPGVKTVILLGMSEGSFPRIPRLQTLISDSDRRALQRRRISIDPGAEQLLLDENLLGYIAFTRASDRLIIIRPMVDGSDKPTGPSAFIRRLRRLFPGLLPIVILRDAASQPACVGTPRQLVTSLMRWVRDDNGSTESESPVSTWAHLYQWLAMRECCEDIVDWMRYRAWPALKYENRPQLSESIATQLFPAPLKASVTRIEAFASCPFKHFLRYGLRLEDRDEPEVTALDLGNVYHHVLERIVREMLNARQDWHSMEPAVAENLIRSYTAEVGKNLRGELMLSSARNKYLLQYIEKTLSRVIQAQRVAALRGSFRPAFAELRFGFDDAQLPPLTIRTPRGRELLLRGQIDRVDLIQDQAQFAVIDYKLRGNPLSLQRVYYGISLQLITYLLVLQANGEKLTGRKLTPAAAFYLRLLRNLDTVKHPDDAADPGDDAFHLKTKPRGILDREVVSHLDNRMDPGTTSDVVQVHIKKDGTLGNRHISDAAEPDEFKAILRRVEKKLGEIGDDILGGKIDIAPYDLKGATPCPACEYRSVCRFRPEVDRYEKLKPMKRETVLALMTEEAQQNA